MQALPRLLAYLRRYRRAFGLGLASVAVTSAIGLTAPWVLKLAVDDLSRGVTRGKLAGYALLLLAIACAGGIFRFLMRRILIGASRDIEYDLRNDFFRHLQQLPLAYFQARRTGDLMSRATNDLGAVRMMIGPAVMYTANTLIVFVVGVTMMVSIDPWLTLVALAPMPVLTLSVKYFGGGIHRGFERVQARLSDMSAVVQESLSGVRVVRAYCQEPSEVERFRRANAEYMGENRALIRLLAVFLPSMTLFLGLGALVVLWMGSREVIRGRITIGDLVAFNAYLGLLSWPMIGFGWVTNLLERGLASWQRMLEVLDTPPAITDAEAGSRITSPAQIRGTIEFRDLTFGYNGRPVLDRVSVTIEAGQTVALVGLTGSGKSTLVNLIPRLHEPPPGTVFVDGVDVREIPLAVLRRAIGFVPQEPFLFSDTIRGNIAFGAMNAGTAAPDGSITVEQAAAIARLDKDLEDFPEGYDSVVGERGITLSGGQKQRTALARAVMVDPRILILDDALSAVDTYTEEEILARLRRVMRQRTSIIISHRISTVRDADQILVLAQGRIAERGRHDELVALGGLYAELHSKQQLEEELAAS
jgi:ATP-binding cassette, subfamily B, multidrug efflux pump